MLSFLTLQIPNGNLDMNLSEFKEILEDHLTFFINDSQTTTIMLSDMEEYRYRGDFQGLLVSKNVDVDLHWIIMRMSGLHNPTSYSGGLKKIHVPSKARINLYLNRLLNVTNFAQ